LIVAVLGLSGAAPATPPQMSGTFSVDCTCQGTYQCDKNFNSASLQVSQIGNEITFSTVSGSGLLIGVVDPSGSFSVLGSLGAYESCSGNFALGFIRMNCFLANSVAVPCDFTAGCSSGKCFASETTGAAGSVIVLGTSATASVTRNAAVTAGATAVGTATAAAVVTGSPMLTGQVPEEASTGDVWPDGPDYGKVDFDDEEVASASAIAWIALMCGICVCCLACCVCIRRCRARRCAHFQMRCNNQPSYPGSARPTSPVRPTAETQQQAPLLPPQFYYPYPPMPFYQGAPQQQYAAPGATGAMYPSFMPYPQPVPLATESVGNVQTQTPSPQQGYVRVVRPVEPAVVQPRDQLAPMRQVNLRKMDTSSSDEQFARALQAQFDNESSLV